MGLATAYAGYASDADLCQLRDLVGPFLPQLAQGAAFAAKARQRAGNLTNYQNVACNIFCDLSAEDAAAVSDDALRDQIGRAHV